MNKAFLRTFSMVLLLAICCFSFSCKKDEQKTLDEEIVYEARVITLDVSSGNATLINLPSLTILIDCGPSGEVGANTVEKLKTYGVTDVDYFILSHMDENHIGATELVLDNFNVKTAYVPDIPDAFISEYSLYEGHYNSIKNKLGEANLKKNKIFERIIFDDGVLLFLSPLERTNVNSSYSKLLATATPNARLIDDVSPIIYLSYKGVRFVISSDAGVSQEKEVLSNYEIGFYDSLFYGEHDVNLDEGDFWALSSHGDDTGNSDEFIKVLKPKNALISVSSENQGCPKNAVIENVYGARTDCKFFSTMLVGDICAYVSANGEYTVKTQKDMQK